MPSRVKKPINNWDTTAKQQAFLEEYINLRELNATEAARRVGLTGKSAKVMASRWLGRTDVQAQLTAMREERSKIVFADAAIVIEELLILARSDISEIVRVDKDGRLWLRKDIPAHAWRAVKSITFKHKAEGGKKPKTKTFETGDLDAKGIAKALSMAGDENTVEVKVEMHDKPRAINLLASHLGMLNKNITMHGKLSLVDVIRASMQDDEETEPSASL